MEAADVEVDLRGRKVEEVRASCPLGLAAPPRPSHEAGRGVQVAAFHWDFRDKVQSAGRGTRRPVNG